MQIKRQEIVDLKALGIDSTSIVHLVHVKILDVHQKAQEIITMLTDKSWISKLHAVPQLSYQSRAQKTIEKLVTNILTKVEDTVTEDFGEYLVSDSAGESLVQIHQHSKIPLAELWKEQMTGNPGFDFHTESASNLIAFGEAKFKTDGSPYSVALTQIADFIIQEKDLMEVNDLQNFVSATALTNIMDNKKRAFIAAFSMNANNPALIFQNALKHDRFKELVEHAEIYLIAVEV